MTVQMFALLKGLIVLAIVGAVFVTGALAFAFALNFVIKVLRFLWTGKWDNDYLRTL